TTSVNITGFTLATLYDWRVRTNCATGSSGFTTAQFTTAATATCNAPAGLNTTSITTSSATAGWTAVSGAVNYTVEYKLNSAPTWTVFAAATTSTSVNITGLVAASAYNWRVLTNCTSGSSAYTQANFTTASPGCSSQYDVTTNGTSSGAALIPFNTNITGLISPSGDNDYYKFVISNSGTATITLTTLPADYDIRVYRSNGTSQVGISQVGGTGSETITRTYSAGTYYVRVYGYNGANNATICYTLRIATGTASFSDEPVENVFTKTVVFPNPARKSVTVGLNELKGTAELMVYDIYGKLLSKQKTSQLYTKVDISTLPSGTYVIRIKQNGKDTNLKIVKQ
ncbi:MAG: T9SS type A sorting domain-containing protein, partial [Ferruginibacter sp.]